ncbi:C5 cytosine-specific DNA methylase superfamily protein [Pelomyxa schiedti]|nr:C5 cytosine-specific DNA methylase superfamily protein [Pelomyxa schiedti]
MATGRSNGRVVLEFYSGIGGMHHAWNLAASSHSNRNCGSPRSIANTTTAIGTQNTETTTPDTSNCTRSSSSFATNTTTTTAAASTSTAPPPESATPPPDVTSAARYASCGRVDLHSEHVTFLPFDIDQSANMTYETNFGGTVNNKNLESITCQYLDDLGADTWLMSPPCQPYNSCVMSKQLDLADSRARSLITLTSVLSHCTNKPNYFLLENVKVFQSSASRNQLVEVLRTTGYHIQEFLLSPANFGIPNQRLRYFLLAKRHPLNFSHSNLNDTVSTQPPPACCLLPCNPLRALGDFFDSPPPPLELYSINPQQMKKGLLFDIVNKNSLSCCCFTKGYTRIVEGTGSVIQTVIPDGRNDPEIVTDVERLNEFGLRYFTPSEIARLHCFPDSFRFPPTMQTRKKYQLLGNSLNCLVVANLLHYLHCNTQP